LLLQEEIERKRAKFAKVAEEIEAQLAEEEEKERLEAAKAEPESPDRAASSEEENGGDDVGQVDRKANKPKSSPRVHGKLNFSS